MTRTPVPASPSEEQDIMRLRVISFVIVVAIGVLAVMAWQRNTARAPASAEAPGAPAETPAAGGMPMTGETPSPASDPGIEWQIPGRWVAELAQGMRLASYVVPAPGEGGENAQCAVYYFGPGQGGGVDANLERWIGEFQNPGTPARRTREIHGLHVSQVEVTGAYAAHAGAPGEAPGVKSGWTLLGAVVEGPSGAVFFKLTGPGPTIAAAAKEFDGMLTSLRKKK
jgi:hypothetical protein